MSTAEEELLETRALLELSLAQLSDTTRSSHPAHVSRFPGAPSCKTLSQFKARNFPAIFTDAFPEWPAHEKWCGTYFEDVMGEDKVTCAVTPDGRADSVVGDLFVMPHEQEMKMSEMIGWLRHPTGDVRYLQLQNGSLHIEFKKLAGDVDAHGPTWARDAFAATVTPLPSSTMTNTDTDSSTTNIIDTATASLSQEEIVNKCVSGDCLGNIWIGNHLSKTSLHHDPYENIYVQIRGAKRFTLYPPCEYHWLQEKRYKAAKYVPDANGKLKIEQIDAQSDDADDADDALRVPWLTGPKDSIDGSRTAQGMQVTLQAGETLYLPALWFHSVEQIDDDEGLCVALNYWYDLDYDSDLWRNWKFIRKMSMLAQGRLDECRRELEDEEDL